MNLFIHASNEFNFVNIIHILQYLINIMINHCEHRILEELTA